MLRFNCLTSIFLTTALVVACGNGSVQNVGPTQSSGMGGTDAGNVADSGDAAVSFGSGFLHASGTEIVDGLQQPILLRAVGLGNWLLPEGYMWKLSSSDKARDIEKAVEAAVGPNAAAEFWAAWRDTFFTEADVSVAAQMGFNAVRVAMNSRLLLPEDQDKFNETEFARLGSLVEWCERHQIYVIFDMHAAPGGQTGHNAIDDSPTNTPELFNSSTYQDRLVRLWTEIARRFATSRTVAGYDLLNEPINPDFAELNDKLWPLYIRIGTAIRDVDHNHALIVEGAGWANNWSTLGEPFDDNMIYSFHKYWDNTDQPSVQPFIDKRTEWNRPIWCGEMGEPRSLDWPQHAVSLLESNGIGWTYWPWKKMDTNNDPYSIDYPNNWNSFRYLVANPGAPQPDAGTPLQDVFDDYLDKIALNKCHYNKDLVCGILAAACN